MTIQTGTLKTVMIAALAAVAIAGLSVQAPDAQPRQGRGGPGFGRGGPGPFAILQQLNLTDAQREQIRTILEERRQNDGTQMNKMGDLQRDLQAAVFADTPDQTKIDQLKAAINEAQTAALAERVEVELRIAQVLTAEQRQKARELAPGGRSGRF